MVDILHRVGAKASIEKTYDALATPEGVAAWWTADTSGAAGVGASMKTDFTVAATGEYIGGFELTVEELIPNQRVAWRVTGGPEEWIGTQIGFDLTSEDDYTVVNFAHTGWREPVEFMAHCSTKWATYLLSLKSYVEVGTGSPAPHDTQISNWH